MKVFRLGNRAAVARKVDAVMPGKQLVQRRHIVGHRAIGRRDDGRCPSHDVICGKQDICTFEREDDVICRVAGGMDAPKRPAIALDDGIVWCHDVGHEISVAARIEKVDLSRVQRAGGAVRSFRHQNGAEFILQHACRAANDRGVCG